MAYDLLLRRQTPRNYARESLPMIPKHPGLLGVGVFAIIHFLPHIIRRSENRYDRRVLADDRASITREMPAISIYELSGARKYPRTA